MFYKAQFNMAGHSHWAGIKHKKGILHINDKKALNKWLDLKVSDADIIMIPNKVEYVEIIGAVNNPGSYKLNSKFSVLDYFCAIPENFEQSLKNIPKHCPQTASVVLQTSRFRWPARSFRLSALFCHLLQDF